MMRRNGIARIARIALALAGALYLCAVPVAASAWAYAAAPENQGDPPVWPFAVGTIAAVAIVAFWTNRRRP